jgi:ribosomal protein S18 acetylase RimI-like enzyme
VGPFVVAEEQVADEELLAGVNLLLPQLSRHAPSLDLPALTEVVRSPCTHLLTARDADRAVVGMLTLVVFSIPTGRRAWIEDVVVREELRGAGLGRALTEAAIALAEELGARTLDLTSRPSREAAHRLYTSVGFAVRETVVYRFERASRELTARDRAE